VTRATIVDPIVLSLHVCTWTCSSSELGCTRPGRGRVHQPPLPFLPGRAWGERKVGGRDTVGEGDMYRVSYKEGVWFTKKNISLHHSSQMRLIRRDTTHKAGSEHESGNI
jgi:hypothetical protein